MTMQTPSRHFLFVGLRPETREKLRDALGARGNRFHKTDSGREALELSKQIEPSVVFTAGKFAQGNGYDLCETIKGESSLPHVGVILFEETDEPYDASRAVLAGIDHFFTSRTNVDRIAELTQAVVERVEREKPLSTRGIWPKSNPIPAPAARDIAKPGEVDTAFYHGFEKAEPQTAGRNLGGGAPQDHGDSDPLREFFDDKPRSVPAPVPDSPPVRDTAALVGRFEVVSDEASEEITRHVEAWVEMHFGQKVDESIRQEVSRALRPMAQRIIRNSLQRLVETEKK